MKLRLKILAWAHIVLGGLGLGALGLFIGVFAAARDPAYDDEFGLFVGGLTLLSVVYFLPSFAGGVGLLRGLPWARAILWIEAALLAFAIPFGTVLAGFSLWALLSTRNESADGGMAQVEAFVLRAVRPLVLALIALFTLGVILVTGYVFRDVIDSPRKQVLTPLPSGAPNSAPEPPQFEMPDLNQYRSQAEPER